jgi:two-component system, cell cycle response regulator DivK
MTAGESMNRSRDERAATVLIADDSFDTRQMYRLYFGHEGYRTYTAADGDAAVHIARTVMPDVIVMDLSMPLVDGLTAVKQLRREPQIGTTPVILLTGYPSKAVERDAVEAGVNVFLTKPCLPEDLERRVRQLLTAR